jgi:hypothetical protein
MRNPNKYNRNKYAKDNARRRAFAINGGEFAYRSYMPFMWAWSKSSYDHEEQLKNHIEYIENHWMRSFLNGNNRGAFHAPKWFKKNIERSERHFVNQKIRECVNVDIEDLDDYTFPVYKHHADWEWF